MSTQDSVDAPPVDKIERPSRRSLVAIDEHAPGAKSVITTRQIYGLMAYYMALLIGCIVGIAILIWKDGSILKAVATDDALLNKRLLASMAFLVSGAVVGSVLYQIRMLFRSYIKFANFDSRWLPKYISAPLEAAALALAIASLIQGGAIVLGGQNFDFAKGNLFAAFGFGALVGFGIREVIGWLGTVSKTVFPTDTRSETALQSAEASRRKHDAARE